jgi:ABC-2 type transport system ATP-binding protein
VPAAAVEIRGLRKEYRRRYGRRIRAVDGLDLDVPTGGVFGFIGPNGSGKTSTIRCLLGLARATAGSCRLLGAEVPRELPRVIARVGALVESPGLNPGLTGRRHLEVLATLADCGRRRVEVALDAVDLVEQADDLVRTYSLGTRQRLGVATALLKDPDVLVLDEPANGLDPGGMREMRTLLRRLAAQGRTVFLSSHLLTEVQHVCDRLAIVARGRAVAVGKVGEVLDRGRRAAIFVRLADVTRGLQVLRAAGLPAHRDGEGLRVEISVDGAEVIARVLATGNLFPTELRPVAVSLEDLFLELTREEDEPR